MRQVAVMEAPGRVCAGQDPPETVLRHTEALHKSRELVVRLVERGGVFSALSTGSRCLSARPGGGGGGEFLHQLVDAGGGLRLLAIQEALAGDEAAQQQARTSPGTPGGAPKQGPEQAERLASVLPVQEGPLRLQVPGDPEQLRDELREAVAPLQQLLGAGEDREAAAPQEGGEDRRELLPLGLDEGVHHAANAGVRRRRGLPVESRRAALPKQEPQHDREAALLLEALAGRLPAVGEGPPQRLDGGRLRLLRHLGGALDALRRLGSSVRLLARPRALGGGRLGIGQQRALRGQEMQRGLDHRLVRQPVGVLLLVLRVEQLPALADVGHAHGLEEVAGCDHARRRELEELEEGLRLLHDTLLAAEHVAQDPLERRAPLGDGGRVGGRPHLLLRHRRDAGVYQDELGVELGEVVEAALDLVVPAEIADVDHVHREGLQHAGPLLCARDLDLHGHLHLDVRG
mmetsp:Transcript_34383/g.75056  ORF Transcript_34383/g.75056 Transcript_34383/m.75056 type:complete len:460 (+) Transcript_34383:1596-2975(+)